MFYLEMIKYLGVGKKEIFYVILMGIALALGFLRNIVFATVLSPELMGYYSIALTIASYGMLLQLGVINGLGRELPISFGKKNLTYASSLVGEATLAIVFLQLVGILIFYVIILATNFADPSTRDAFLWGGFLAFSIPFSQIVMLRLRSEQRVLTFSLLQVLNSIAILTTGMVAIKYFNYKGAICSIIFVNFLTFIIISKTSLNPVNFRRFNFGEIKYLVRIGLPLMLAGVLASLQMSLDRLFLINNFSPKDIGIYQIGMIPLTLGIAVSGIISQYISPKLLFRYGKGHSLKFVFIKARMVSLITIGIMMVFLPFVPFVSRTIVDLWLPKYKESIDLITIFYVGAIFTSANILGLVTNAANRQMLDLYQIVFLVLISFGGYLLVSRYNMPLVWYAYMNTAVQIVYFFITSMVSYYIVKSKK